MTPPRFEVVVRYRNGRYLKSARVPSRYAAKQQQDAYEEKYKDTNFYVEIKPLQGSTAA